MRKKIIAFVFLCVVCVSISSCYYEYKGEEEALYTVAISNIFGAAGYESNGEISYDPKITVLEKDSYGRTLFLYDEIYCDVPDCDSLCDYGAAFCIMQSSTASHVYYYQDVCYFPCINFLRFEEPDVLAENNAELIKKLKEQNDWDNPLDLSVYEKSMIITEKSEGKLTVDSAKLEKLVLDRARQFGYTGSDTSIFRYSRYCNTDKYGRELYYLYAMGMDYNADGSTFLDSYDFALIVNPDGKINANSIVKIDNPAESYEKVLKLKEEHGWNTKEWTGTYRYRSSYDKVVFNFTKILPFCHGAFLLAGIVFSVLRAREYRKADYVYRKIEIYRIALKMCFITAIVAAALFGPFLVVSYFVSMTDPLVR